MQKVINRNYELISEYKYFNSYREELSQFSCPLCQESGGLFIGAYSVGCYMCFNFFGIEDLYKKGVKI